MLVAAAAGMKAAYFRNSFEECRFSRAIFTDEEGYRRRKFEKKIVVLQKGQPIERKVIRLDLLGQKGNPLQEGGFKGAFWRIVATSSRAPCGN